MKYGSTDIKKMITKRALGYFILVEIIGILISLLIMLTGYVRQAFPYLPTWILPIFFAIIFVLVGVLIWKRLSETNVLKYEFITTMAHKFRTPLTRIKWAAEDLESTVPAGKKEDIGVILESEQQLLALTEVLVHFSAIDTSHFDYHPVPMDVGSLFADLSAQYGVRAEKKKIALSFSNSSGISIVADAEKSGFIFQILLDNALNYTSSGGSIDVKAHPDPDGKHCVIKISDTGIGMSKETAARVFLRFYRGENAKHTDNEGMGIGLFMAKNIVEKQGGKISVESEGEGKGSIFSVCLPLCKNSTNRN